MKNCVYICVLSLLYACSSSNTKDVNKAFSDYKERFVLALWKQNPTWASSVGFHDYDSVLIVPTSENKAKGLEFSKKHLDSLEGFDPLEMSTQNQTDYEMIKNHLSSNLWYEKTLKSFEWNPAEYNVCGTFAEMLANDYAPITERLTNFNLRMKNVPAYYKAAEKWIKNPTKEHTELAISQNSGGISCFTSELDNALQKSTLSATEKLEIKKQAGNCVNAINRYVTFLKKIDHKKARTFRLGKQLFEQKFKFDIQASSSAKEIYMKALSHKKQLHSDMYDRALKLWPTYFGSKQLPADTNNSMRIETIRQVINEIVKSHTKPENFQAEIERQIPILTAFVKKKNLLYLDPSKPLVVRKEPAYMAGVAGASISSPGPYDKGGNTYYNVGSMGGWSAEQAESYLREYNDYTLQILNIHEAIPGHYAQLVYANQSPSIIKTILGNGAMIEGWAVYTERMMLENGYGNQSDEMWLMYYKWNLRTTCNTILDYGIHVTNLSKEQGLDLLQREAFQEKTEAEGKWKRATLSQVQLCSYFTGYSEIMDLRNSVMKKQGKKFKLKEFHEQFLSYGSAPVKTVRKLMEGN
jgi:uncharacterized protein (DUF885 family)